MKRQKWWARHWGKFQSLDSSSRAWNQCFLPAVFRGTMTITPLMQSNIWHSVSLSILPTIYQQRAEVIQWKCNNVLPTLLWTYFGVLEAESKQFEQERNQSVWLRKMSFPAFSWTLLSFCLCLPPIDHLVLKAHLSQLLIIMKCIWYQALDAVQVRQATGPCVPSASQSFSSICKPAWKC